MAALGPTATEIMREIKPLIDDLKGEVRELRTENRLAHEQINGRLRDCEVNAATAEADIRHLQDAVKTLSFLDKAVAILSSAIAGVLAVVFGK